MNFIRLTQRLGPRITNTFSEASTVCNTLYTQASLGIDSYAQNRDRTSKQFGNTQEKFKSKMKEFSEAGGSSMIFTEDLKSIVHLADDSPEDISLVKAMIYKFNQQNKEMRFGSYVFGPVIMRMFYLLNKPQEAYEAFKDENLADFFNQYITYQILMDLLLINTKYKEVLDVFNIIKDRQGSAKFSKHVILLHFAACFKMNTPESLKASVELWQEIKKIGHVPMRRATGFAAALALKQNAPHIALEIITTEPRQGYHTVRNIKAIALAELGRPEDCLPLLRNVLVVDGPQEQKHTFVKDAIDKIRSAVSNCADKEVVTEFERIEKQLIQNELISNETLDEILCQEIDSIPISKAPGDRMLAASYNRRNVPRGGTSYRKRPGLEDLI